MNTAAEIAQGAGAGSGGWLSIVVTVVVSSGFTGLVATFLTGFINRRNLNADTTLKITGAADTMLEKFNADNERLRANEIVLESNQRKLSNTLRIIGADHLAALDDLEGMGVDVTERRTRIQDALREVENL